MWKTVYLSNPKCKAFPILTWGRSNTENHTTSSPFKPREGVTSCLTLRRRTIANNPMTRGSFSFGSWLAHLCGGQFLVNFVSCGNGTLCKLRVSTRSQRNRLCDSTTNCMFRTLLFFRINSRNDSFSENMLPFLTHFHHAPDILLHQLLYKNWGSGRLIPNRKLWAWKASMPSISSLSPASWCLYFISWGLTQDQNPRHGVDMHAGLQVYWNHSIRWALRILSPWKRQHHASQCTNNDNNNKKNQVPQEKKRSSTTGEKKIKYHKKTKLEACVVAQHIKVPATKPEDLDSVPGIHVD